MAELISVIVATYNREDALAAVLRSLSRQTDRDFELLIADDGSGTATARLVTEWSARMPVPLRHVWHSDRGFRLAEIRNRAIRASAGRYCVFLDGDCIARPDFIAAHRRLTHKKGHYKQRVTGVTINDKVVTAHSYLASFLWTAVPFVVAHGIFLGLILGVFWKDKFGAFDPDDLRLGVELLLVAMSASFAVDMFQLQQRPFAWIRQRADALMVRSMVIHMVIIFGMALAAFSNNNPAHFFNVFLVLKFLADLSSELPQWEPKKPPEALTRMADKVQKKTQGKKGGKKDDEPRIIIP